MSVDYSGNIRSKKCGNTGFTEEVLGQLYKRKGGTILMISEVKVEETREKSDGSRKVEFIIQNTEPVLDGNLNGRAVNTIQNVMRALYVIRQQDQQLPLSPGDHVEPTVEDTLAAMEAAVQTDGEGEVTGFYEPGTDPDVGVPADREPGQVAVDVGDPFADPETDDSVQDPDEPVQPEEPVDEIARRRK